LDTPLLFETGLDKHCDALVFVKASDADRLSRVKERGWGTDELARREKSQMPLDNKAELSHYSIANPADAGDESSVCNQVREVLSRILERVAAAG
jgi:dephospho-CoA kinase